MSKSIKDTLERHRTRIMSIDSVTGVGVGLSKQDPGEPCILVYVTSELWPASLEKVIEGFPVEISRTSGFKSL